MLGVHRDGGLCARIAVPAGNLIDADGLSALDAAMVEFLAIGAHAVRRVRGGPGRPRAGGRRGAHRPRRRALRAARGGRGPPARRERRPAGASPGRVAGSTACTSRGDGRPRRSSTGGFDAVFDATGKPAAMEGGFARVAHGGSLVLVSVVQGRISFEDPEFHKREMRVVGSRNALAPDFRQAMEALRTGAIDGAGLRTEVLPLADFAGRFADLARDRGHLVKAIVRP